MAVAAGTAWRLFAAREDTSYLEQSGKRLGGDAKSKGKVSDSNSDPGSVPHGVQEGSGGDSHYQAADERAKGSGQFKYHAAQVILRQGGDPDKRLPIGTSFVGKLLTGIDTRNPGALVRVLAPYGASFDHDRRIDRGSVVFGTASYTGSGDKVYLKFNRVLYPDGREFRIEAEALSSSDYTSGISGEENDGAGGKIGATLGLTMLSGITDTMVQKETLGQYAEPTAKSTLTNGFYNGLSKASQEEAQRQAAKVQNVPDYVTIEAGLDLIVSLMDTFKGEPL